MLQLIRYYFNTLHRLHIYFKKQPNFDTQMFLYLGAITKERQNENLCLEGSMEDRMLAKLSRCNAAEGKLFVQTLTIRFTSRFFPLIFCP